MNNPLATYLHDHLAGSRFALELLESLLERYSGEPLGECAARLHSEIGNDQRVLRDLVSRVGEGSADLRESVGWIGEKLTRWKLTSGSGWNLGTLEAVETLALGIQGKAALWRALAAAEDTDSRLRGQDYRALLERARVQHDELEQHRIEVARALFARREAA
jgi:hypothetical protein